MMELAREVLVHTLAPGLAGFLDPESNERLPTDFEALVPAVTEPEEVEAVVALLRDRDEPETLRNEAINLLRRSQHPGLVAELIAVLDDELETERFRGFAAQHLGIILYDGDDDSAVITQRLRLALHDRHLDVRRETLRALERVADPEAIALLAGGLAPEAPEDVRDLVIRAAYRAGRRDLAPEIRPYLTGEDPVIRIAAIYVLGQWRDEASRPELVTALRDTDPRVAGAAEVALANLGPQNE